MVVPHFTYGPQERIRKQGVQALLANRRVFSETGNAFPDAFESGTTVAFGDFTVSSALDPAFFHARIKLHPLFQPTFKELGPSGHPSRLLAGQARQIRVDMGPDSSYMVRAKSGKHKEKVWCIF
jgi:hypothetical protein